MSGTCSPDQQVRCCSRFYSRELQLLSLSEIHRLNRLKLDWEKQLNHQPATRPTAEVLFVTAAEKVDSN